MRIGITCYPSHGGSGVVATELGKNLASRGHEVAFISYATPLRLRQLPPRITFHEVETIKYPLLEHFPHSLALASKMVEVARMKKLQILHVHYAIPFAVTALLAKDIASELDLKVVTTLHGTDITLVGNNASFKPVTKMAIERSDAVTAVSHFLREETYRQFDVDKEIDVVYNFIDSQKYNTDTPSPLPPANNGQATIIHISNFRPVKRIDDVVKIFAVVAQKVDARLVLVGDGPCSAMAEQMIHDLNISDKVIFTGIVEEVAPLLKSADVLLLPSQTESFGLAALEAMANGVGVVATDVGGLPEIIEHDTTGYLAPLGDVDKMANYVLKILAEKSNFGIQARQRALTTFNSDNIIPYYESIYEKVLLQQPTLIY